MDVCIAGCRGRGRCVERVFGRRVTCVLCVDVCIARCVECVSVCSEVCVEPVGVCNARCTQGVGVCTVMCAHGMVCTLCWWVHCKIHSVWVCALSGT